MSGMRKGTRQRYDDIAELFRQGKSRREISETLHYTKQTVDRVIRQYGLAPKQETFEAHKEEIIEMRKSGMTYQEIADATGLSMSTVSRNMQYMDIECDKSGRGQKERKPEIVRVTAERHENVRPEQYAKDTRQIRHIEVQGKSYQDVTDFFM